MYKYVTCPKCGIDWTEIANNQGWTSDPWRGITNTWECPVYDRGWNDDRIKGCGEETVCDDWFQPPHIIKWKLRLENI